MKVIHTKLPNASVIPPQAEDHSGEDDETLALRWKDGDREAYESLVQRHLDPIHRFVSSRLGHHADADDVCQEVFIEVCLKIRNFNPAYPFKTWLFTVARNKVADRFRRLKPSEEFIPEIHGDVDDTGPSHALDRHESARQAWEEVFRILPENQATALWLKIQGQMSVLEICSTMDQSESNVKVLLFRARKTLAQTWKPSSYFDS